MKKIKEALQIMLLLVLMVVMGCVPESDIPKEEKKVLQDADLGITYIAVTTAEEVSQEPEEVVVEEVEEVATEEVEEAPEETEEEVVEQIEEAIEEEREAFDDWGNGMEYLGAYDITAYEWTGYPCANGNYPTVGYTVACNSLPLGTVLYIDGIGYRTVEDRGATWHSDWWIDLYLGDVAECYEWGIRTRDVWIVTE